MTHSLYHEFGFRNTFNFGHDFVIPELSGMEESDLLRDFNGRRRTWESLSSIFSSVRCSTHGQLLSISNSMNSSIESGYRGPNASSFQDSDNYPIFCNISNSLGSLVKAAHYSSIFNGIGNEISQSGTKIKSANSTILNGNRNKILTEVSELNATDVLNNTYSTILNGRNNTIYGRRSTIINGAENTLSGRNNLIFGDENNILGGARGVSDYSLVFGEQNTISGVANLNQITQKRVNYVFGKKNQLLSCSDLFVVGGHILNAQDQSASDSVFVESADIFCFDSRESTVSGSFNSEMKNIYSSDLSVVDDSSISNVYNCNVFNLSSSSANNLRNSNARSILSSNLNYVNDSELSGINRCSVFNLLQSDISNAADSKIQGNNININHDLDYSDILGSNINLTGKVLVERSRILGENIDFLGLDDTFTEFRHCDILGYGNTLSGAGDSVSNLLIKGVNNSIKDSSNVFIYGDGINVQNSNKSTFFGEDIESSGSSTFVFGENIDSQHVAGSVIKDSKITQTQSKGEDTLFLDFDQGTYMNVPLWTGASTPGVGGQIMYSGDHMYINNGSSWREINTSAV